MAEEMRVTIVVTGLGRDFEKEEAKPQAILSKSTRSDGAVDYHQLDRPTYLRQQDTVKKTSEMEDLREKDAEYLDIPAFLRRQED